MQISGVQYVQPIIVRKETIKPQVSTPKHSIEVKLPILSKRQSKSVTKLDEDDLNTTITSQSQIHNEIKSRRYDRPWAVSSNASSATRSNSQKKQFV